MCRHLHHLSFLSVYIVCVVAFFLFCSSASQNIPATPTRMQQIDAVQKSGFVSIRNTCCTSHIVHKRRTRTRRTPQQLADRLLCGNLWDVSIFNARSLKVLCSSSNAVRYIQLEQTRINRNWYGSEITDSDLQSPGRALTMEIWWISSKIQLFLSLRNDERVCAVGHDEHFEMRRCVLDDPSSNSTRNVTEASTRIMKCFLWRLTAD